MSRGIAATCSAQAMSHQALQRVQAVDHFGSSLQHARAQCASRGVQLGVQVMLTMVSIDATDGLNEELSRSLSLAKEIPQVEAGVQKVHVRNLREHGISASVAPSFHSTSRDQHVEWRRTRRYEPLMQAKLNQPAFHCLVIMPSLCTLSYASSPEARLAL